LFILLRVIRIKSTVFYPWGLQADAIRFKNCLQENSKIHIMIEDMIEDGHNRIVAWEGSSNVMPILIRDEEDFIKN
jgi:glucose/mannose-6-phosphate isomerase